MPIGQLQDFPPVSVVAGAAAVVLVHDDRIKKVPRIYNANAILIRIADAGAMTAVPAKSIHKTPRPLDAAALYEKEYDRKALRQNQGVLAGSHVLRKAFEQLPVRNLSDRLGLHTTVQMLGNGAN